MNKWSILVCMLVLFNSVVSAVAQKSAKDQIPVLQFPDFLHVDVPKQDDTSWTYEYYDKDLHRIRLADLKDVSQIDQVKFFKGYKPPTGGAFSPELFHMVYRFVQLDTNIWARFEHETNHRQRYEMLSGNVVRVDTIRFPDPVTRKERKVVYKYIKTKAIGQE